MIKGKEVRLKPSQISMICEAFRSSFLENDHLWLFGSRANLSKRGGDIDLYVETSLGVDKVLEAKLFFARQLFKTFDDQKIDIVIRHQDAKNSPIYKHAKETGVQIL